MKIAVIDGQGGGLGKAIIETLKRNFPGRAKIIALGTNGVATSTMLKGGADEGASGENALLHNLEEVDIVTGSLSVIIPNAMLGEITPRMVSGVFKSPAQKYLLPVNNKLLYLVGVKEQPMQKFVEELVLNIKEQLEKKSHLKRDNIFIKK
ncbi:MAG: DUF3842 family protein [Candidatus Syntrophonatronum acetioxidans]|uniref:DUF3842 family protein n=1 Tax=Candidatus Syntrophonatronum acetioxidans TaxID=1795816 RepID=A0A424YC87_9FIRM|nr:MAG: DUF3842 family protein [Candidatus Syntrophonatronum acetioxidans]